jgi:hypothetical protein
MRFNWEEVHQNLGHARTILLTTVKSGVSEAVTELNEYLDHNELSLAWDVAFETYLQQDLDTRKLLDTGGFSYHMALAARGMVEE